MSQMKQYRGFDVSQTLWILIVEQFSSGKIILMLFLFACDNFKLDRADRKLDRR